MTLWAAFGIGLLGSAHCLGMCAPVVIAMNPSNKPGASALHHGGRLLTYALFGAVAGMLGKSFEILGVQQGFSLVIGILLVLSVLAFPFVRKMNRVEERMGRVAIRFQGMIRQWGLSKNGLRFMSGMGNGLLPCGLVYLAVAGAANTFTPWDGALFMLVFGTGTLPMLIGANWLGSRLGHSVRQKIRKLMPAAILVMGCLLMVRGMNLGIPYLSPERAAAGTEIVRCD